MTREEKLKELSAKIIPLQAKIEGLRMEVKYKGWIWLQDKLNEYERQVESLRDIYFNTLGNEQR
jgi:hypothetical protein